MNKNMMARLGALALALTVLAGCAAQQQPEPAQTPGPAPEQSQSAQPAATVKPTATPEPTVTPAPEPTATPEPTDTPEATAKPTPEPTAAPTLEPTPSGPEDGNYTAAVTLSGGTGRATVQSPAKLRCTGGQFFATIVWSSPNFDYMKVNGVRYDLISAPGSNSTFEIPVAAFDRALPVIADTVAMSEPHEVEYALTFDSASLTKQ